MQKSEQLAQLQKDFEEHKGHFVIGSKPNEREYAGLLQDIFYLAEGSDEVFMEMIALAELVQADYKERLFVWEVDQDKMQYETIEVFFNRSDFEEESTRVHKDEYAYVPLSAKAFRILSFLQARIAGSQLKGPEFDQAVLDLHTFCMFTLLPKLNNPELNAELYEASKLGRTFLAGLSLAKNALSDSTQNKSKGSILLEIFYPAMH